MTILFNGRFTDGGEFSDYYSVDRDPDSDDIPPVSAGVEGAYELVTRPSVLNDTICKITIVNAAPGRCELRPYQTDIAGPGPVWGERWYAWWTYLPEDWEAPISISVDSNGQSDSRVMIGQLHDTPDIGDAVHQPPFLLYLDGSGYYKLATTYDTVHPTTENAPNLQIYKIAPVELGVWVEWVLHINEAYDSNGFIHFYKDRRIELDVTSTPNQYNDTVGPFFKAGLYAYGNVYSPATRYLYSQGIVIGDANSSYLEVTGRDSLQRAVIRSVA